jgi:voltage-gated potassium channel Kch
MGALIAGISISTFPYNLDVVAKVISIRDFFVTLFFVTLGMQIPMPTMELMGLALVASAFLMVSRVVTVFPILRRLQLGHRASLLPSINLAQMSEFSLVIASIGLGDQHIDRKVMGVLIFVFAFTSVTSTYLIGSSDVVYKWLAGLLRKAGLKDLNDQPAEQAVALTHAGHDIVLLGFFNEASALVHEFEMGSNDQRHPFLKRLLVIDFNPQVHAELKRRQIACIYGDVAHMETLHHAHIENATLVVSTIPDAILKGTDNLRLLKLARRLSPKAKVVVTAKHSAAALALYEEGADYVFVPRLHAAAQMAAVLAEGLRNGFDTLRAEQIAHLRRRNEVLG